MHSDGQQGRWRHCLDTVLVPLLPEWCVPFKSTWGTLTWFSSGIFQRIHQCGKLSCSVSTPWRNREVSHLAVQKRAFTRAWPYWPWTSVPQKPWEINSHGLHAIHLMKFCYGILSWPNTGVSLDRLLTSSLPQFFCLRNTDSEISISHNHDNEWSSWYSQREQCWAHSKSSVHDLCC